MKKSKHVHSIFWPLLLTFLLSNSFTIIDTLMLSNYDENTFNGVVSATQFQAMVGPILFGLLAGIGVYASQYFGAGDHDNLKKTFGLSLLTSIVFGIIGFLILVLFGKNFISFFVSEQTSIDYGLQYLDVIKFSFLIYPVNFAFTFGLRTIKKAKISMYANISKAIINTIFNFLLIYGIFIFPELGIKGAAIATIISQLAILIFNLFLIFKIKPIFIGSFKQMFSFSRNFVKKIYLRALPIVVSEALFGSARFAYTKAFSIISDDAFRSEKVSANINTLLNSFVMATANTSSIIVGAALGAGDMEKVRDIKKTLIRFMLTISGIILILSLFVIPLFVPLYNITDQKVLEVTKRVVQINGIFLALRVFSSSILFILRSGGDTLFAALIDSGVAWMVGIPLTFIVVSNFEVDAITLKIVTLSESFFKAFLALNRFRKDKWIKKII